MKKKTLVVLAALAILAACAYPLLARPDGAGQGFYRGQGQYMEAPAPRPYNNPNDSRGWFSRGYGRGMGMYQEGWRGKSRAQTWPRSYGNTRGGRYVCPYGGRW